MAEQDYPMTNRQIRAKIEEIKNRCSEILQTMLIPFVIFLISFGFTIGILTSIIFHGQPMWMLIPGTIFMLFTCVSAWLGYDTIIMYGETCEVKKGYECHLDNWNYVHELSRNYDDVIERQQEIIERHIRGR